ncbi:hypothetical protein [Pontibacter rugosus]|uniref:Uncharacterized protein n=1 Tax=Pontibacter rugosus TaxID=1745966 RepID=A0ABW3SVL0_9BACT
MNEQNNNRDQLKSNKETHAGEEAHADGHIPSTGDKPHTVAGGRSQNVESIEDIKEDMDAGEDEGSETK